jgi:hypothetical protein
VIDREFGHLTHGYVVTSHASQGATVDKVFIGLSSDSFPATNERTGYVAVTRGKEQALIFTDDKDGLLKAMNRPDDPLSASEVAESKQQATPVKARRPLSPALPSLGRGDHRDSRQQAGRRKRAEATPAVRTSRIRCPLVGGATVTVAGADISLDEAIEALKDAIKAMTKARDTGLDAKTAQAVWRDMAKAG